MLFLMAGTLTCQPTSPLLISGMVTDADGAPPATAVLGGCPRTQILQIFTKLNVMISSTYKPENE